MKHSLLVALLLIVALGIAGFGYSLWSAKRSTSPTGMSVELMPGSTTDESVSASIPRDTIDLDVGSDAEAADQLMAEIEKAATGDEGALENEYVAESESFMEGAVVLEQLGTNHDETSY